jgi:hypothetical protein
MLDYSSSPSASFPLAAMRAGYRNHDLSRAAFLSATKRGAKERAAEQRAQGFSEMRH